MRHTWRHLYGQTDSITQLKDRFRRTAEQPHLSAVENVKKEAYINIECEKIQRSSHKDGRWKTTTQEIKPGEPWRAQFSSDSSLSDIRVAFRSRGEAFTHEARCQHVESVSTYSDLLGVRWDDSSYAAEWRCIYISLTLVPPRTQGAWDWAFSVFLLSFEKFDIFKTSGLSSSCRFSSTGPNGQTVQWSSQTHCRSPLVTGASEMRFVEISIFLAIY